MVRVAVLLVAAIGAATALAARARGLRAVEELRHPPVVVTSPLRLPAMLVVGAHADWYRAADGPPRYGDPVPVVITAYCLNGTTRRGRYVRSGIVAADPRYFPLSRYIELYVGSRYLGRFLVDDTGKNIRGKRIDVWLPTCREATRFGRVRGTAVLVPRPEAQLVQAGVAAKR